MDVGSGQEPYPPDPTALELLKREIAKKVDGMHPSSLGQRVAMEHSMLSNWFRHSSGDPEERLEAWMEQWEQ